VKINPAIKAFGDLSYRGNCPTENAEQITFFNYLRNNWPAIGAIAIHIKNEGKRTHHQAARAKAEGMVAGASDIIIPGSPAFVCELKRQDHTRSQWQPKQQEYLLTAQRAGAFVCVAFGYRAALEAIEQWLDLLP